MAARQDSLVPDPLILDLLEWIARSPRSYREVMDDWRTSCPRLTVWEDAIDRGLIVRAEGGRVEPTVAGLHWLMQYRRLPADIARA
ncbi:MAG: hypothetical protein ACLP8B_24050 [Xanthobacteraceae bacterium]